MNRSKVIVIFGTSGRTCKEISDAARTRGIKVRDFNHNNPTKGELQQAVHGVDCAVIVFGPRPPYTDVFCADMTQKNVSVIETEGTKHLICQTGAMIGNYPKNRSILFKLFSGRFKKSNPQGYLDRVKQEDVVKNSLLEWTIVKPPRLTNAISNKKIRVGENINVGFLSSMSRKNLAQFIIDELVNPKYVRKTIFVKN